MTHRLQLANNELGVNESNVPTFSGPTRPLIARQEFPV
jgi:hypothetical protein